MRRLSLASIDIPECYLASSDEDIALCQKYKVPYVIWHRSMEELQRAAMLEQMKQDFPGINWEKELGISSEDIPEINLPNAAGGEGTEEVPANSDDHMAHSPIGENSMNESSSPVGTIADSARRFDGTGTPHVNNMKLDEYIADQNVKVDADALIKLKLLPKFLSNIVQSIQVDRVHSQWKMGYDKKRKLCIGNLKPKKVLRNLIILDVSGSIPRGISDTMIRLLNTLKKELKADVIVTGSESYGWTYEEELPSPEWIRTNVDLGNESGMFYDLLNTKFYDVEFNNVYSFGDYDCPNSTLTDKKTKLRASSYWQEEEYLAGNKWDSHIACFEKLQGRTLKIKAHNIYHFHTSDSYEEAMAAVKEQQSKTRIDGRFKSLETYQHKYDDRDARTGYARIIVEANPKAREHYDRDWCVNMYSHYSDFN